MTDNNLVFEVVDGERSESQGQDLIVNESDIVVEASIEVDESDTFQPVEYSEWTSPDDFTNYIVASVRSLPPVFAGSANSLRRTFKYLKNVQAELIEGVEQDAPYADLKEDHLRTLDSIEEGIESALGQITASIDNGLVKTATKSSNFVYYVNPFIFSLARVLVNGKVSQGKNIETLFANLDKKFKLNDRERLELHYVLNDMGYVIRSSPVDHADMMETYFA